MPIVNNPFIRKIRIKNGYRSEFVCAFWDEDSIEFAMLLLKRRAGIRTSSDKADAFKAGLVYKKQLNHGAS